MTGKTTAYLVLGVWVVGLPLAARWPAAATLAVLATFALAVAWKPARGGWR